MAQELGLASVYPQRAGMRCRRSAGRSRRRVPRTRPRPAPKSRPPSKKNSPIRSPTKRHAIRPPGRALLHGRAPHRAEAGHPPGLGATRAEAHCARPSSLRVALRHRLRRAGHGESHWYVGNGVSKPLFERLLALFAREAGAGPQRTIILLLDGAGWHTEPGLHVPDGLRLVYLPPYTPNSSPRAPLATRRRADRQSALQRLAEIQDASSNAAVTSKLNPTSCEPTPSFVVATPAQTELINRKPYQTPWDCSHASSSATCQSLELPLGVNVPSGSAKSRRHRRG